jgi:hypothetical protein
MTEHWPISWFRDPGLTEPTPLTVTPDGRVFGHLCEFDRAHIGFGGRQVLPPRGDDMRFFLTGATDVLDDDGTVKEISVGKLTMNTGHAGTDHHVSAAAAAAHYDNTGSIAALVNAGSDTVGIWLAGAMMDDLDAFTARRFRACGASGDWRSINGVLRLVAALSVPVGGFPIPRARVASGAPLALVAAGALAPAAPFGRAVDPSWHADLGGGGVGNGSSGGDGDDLTAEQAALLAAIDDTPALVASLLDTLDETPQQVAAFLAALDDADDAEAFGRLEKVPGQQNWIDKLPAALKAAWNKSIIYRAAVHMHEERGMAVGHAIASAINWCRHIAATGDVKQWKGPQSVNPKSRAECVAALALWESMKAAAKADN